MNETCYLIDPATRRTHVAHTPGGAFPDHVICGTPTAGLLREHEWADSTAEACSNCWDIEEAADDPDYETVLDTDTTMALVLPQDAIQIAARRGSDDPFAARLLRLCQLHPEGVRVRIQASAA